MNFIERIKRFLGKVKTTIKVVRQSVPEYVSAHKTEIAAAMKLADTAYDTFKGSAKMKSVIAFFIVGINAKCGTSFNAEEIGTVATKELEEKFQEIYNSLAD